MSEISVTMDVDAISFFSFFGTSQGAVMLCYWEGSCRVNGKKGNGKKGNGDLGHGKMGNGKMGNR